MTRRSFGPARAPQAICRMLIGGRSSVLLLNVLRQDGERTLVQQRLLKALRTLEKADELGFGAAVASCPELEALWRECGEAR